MERFVSRGGASAQALPGLPDWLSGLLAARGIDTKEKARAFLSPDMSQLSDPFLLSSMDKAIDVIGMAKRENLRAVVYGDYDVDGVCAATIMWNALKTFGVDAAVYIPDRHEEGYGLNAAAIEKIAGKAKLLITVDCGITSVSEVGLAKKLGMRVVVTDHHRLPERLPEADAVISPLLAPYPFPSLCGAGVAYQVCRALLSDGAAEDCLDLAALATVADMVPLTDENRALVCFGLKKLSKTNRPGLKALIRVAALPDELNSGHVAFGLAPRLNACGRLSTALTALTLLQTEDEEEAQALALQMEALNDERRMLERAVEDDAMEKLKAYDLFSKRAIVICGEGYESGVVGLAAGRIAEKTGYPTVILSKQGDMAVGSARSAGGVDIFEALSSCSDLFLRFGGHRQAAGMTLRSADVPALSNRLSDAVKKTLGGAALMPEKSYDAELSLSDVNGDTLGRLAMLEPFGIGNPEPVFLLRDAEILTARAVGAAGAHLKLTLAQDREQRGGIGFGMGSLALHLARRGDALFTPTRNEYMGHVSYECRVKAIRQNPQTMPEDKKSVMDAVLQDFCLPEKNILRFSQERMSDSALEAGMSKPQGTLLFCRAWETALQMNARFPQADFLLGEASDARAYTAVLCGAPLKKVTAPYETVVLCDGQLPFDEKAALKNACPGARLFALQKTDALKTLVAEITPSVEEMRNAYRLLLKQSVSGFGDVARALLMNETRAKAALLILRQLELIDLTEEPFSLALLPMKKCDPLESPLYRRLQSGKEAV